VDLAVPGAEDHVPEEGHLLLELAGGVDHAVYPLLDVRLNIAVMVVRWLVAQHEVFVEGRLRVRVEQFLHHRVVALRGFGFNVGAPAPKPGAAPEVPHNANLFWARHPSLLTR